MKNFNKFIKNLKFFNKLAGIIRLVSKKIYSIINKL